MENQDKLKELRKPFKPSQIGSFPANAGSKAGLSYVGHAAVTDRLLEVDPTWTWDFYETNVPDEYGGIWIKLTVLGVTRIGYGDRGMMKGADGIKNAISDAIKNAAMRFGVALDLWSKEELTETELLGVSPLTLSDSEIELLTKIVEHRKSEFGFNPNGFNLWLKERFNVTSYKELNVSDMTEVVRKLSVAPKGKNWAVEPSKLNYGELSELAKNIFINI